MRRIYLIPLIALVLFAAFYWRHAATVKERQRIETAARVEAQRQRLAVENEARRAARDSAIAAQETRRREREERETRRRARETARETALARRDQAGARRDQLAHTLQRLEKEIPPATETLERYQRELREITAEQTFLSDIYWPQAEQNRIRLTDTAKKLSTTPPPR